MPPSNAVNVAPNVEMDAIIVLLITRSPQGGTLVTL